MAVPNAANDVVPQTVAISPLAQVRVTGGVSLACEMREGLSVVSSLRERDGHKARFPRGTTEPEAVLINTGGGLAGGDNVTHDIQLDVAASATITTQAAERIYRAPDAAPTSIDVNMTLAADTRLAWLPQETIVFNGSRLRRRINVDMASTASLLMVETAVFGRTAHKERVTSCVFNDQWRIRRDDTLVAAEAVRFDGDIAEALAEPSIGNGARVATTLMYLAPNAEDKLDAVRAGIAGTSFPIAASSWNGRLVMRALDRDTEPLRRTLAQIVPILVGRDVPRVWWT